MFPLGEKLFAAGERDFSFFVIKSGKVEVVDNTAGQDEIVAVHELREFTGDVDMLTGRVAIVSAIVRTPCEALEISVKRVASAVGEGAMAVQLAHAYLCSS